MRTFEEIMEMRRLYYQERLSITEIAARTHSDYKTVQKYIDQTNFSFTPTQSDDTSLCPKLDPWKSNIDKWLMDDQNAPRKQRHTAIRVFDRLKNEFSDFNCSYRTVTTYVGVRRKELGVKNDVPHLPLIHHAGECQGDFGAADFIENGVQKSGKYFVLEFPYSNCAFAQLKYGENMECLLESMDAIFRFIGGVPRVIWLDNASTMVHKVIYGGGRKITEQFQRFAEHYHFIPVFMNPGSGNEKGGVESKVGYIRRHMLVPIPEFTDLDEFNDHFLQLQEEDTGRYHYRKNRRISDLFLEDMRELLPLPEEDFDLAGYRVVKTDQTALFTIDDKYTYSSHPDFRRKTIMIKLTSKTVTVLDERNKEIVVHRRLYGEGPQTSINWSTYLRVIAVKPRAFPNTGLADHLPEEMRVFLLSCDNSDRRRILTIMADLNDQKGFDAVEDLISKAVSMHALEPDKFEMLYRRLYTEVPVFPPVTLSSDTPKAPHMSSDLSIYDDLLKGRKE